MDDTDLISERLSGIDDLQVVASWASSSTRRSRSRSTARIVRTRSAVNPTFPEASSARRRHAQVQRVRPTTSPSGRGFTGLIRRAFAGETIVLPPGSLGRPARAADRSRSGWAAAVGVQVTMFPLRRRVAGRSLGTSRCAPKTSRRSSSSACARRACGSRSSAGRMIAWDTNLTARTVHVSDATRAGGAGVAARDAARHADRRHASTPVHAEDRADVAARARGRARQLAGRPIAGSASCGPRRRSSAESRASRPGVARSRRRARGGCVASSSTLRSASRRGLALHASEDGAPQRR